MGWYTCNPMFAERFERAGEVSTQAPSGFTQSMITQLVVKTWGMEGYVRWLKGLRVQYSTRRDALIDAMMNELDITLTKGTGILEGATIFEGSIKESGWSVMTEKKKKIVVSFVPPTSGMFVWVSHGRCIVTSVTYSLLYRSRSTLRVYLHQSPSQTKNQTKRRTKADSGRS
jgi:aromatic amino acid aminotransferase I / 2-aminoadipate transaminase